MPWVTGKYFVKFSTAMSASCLVLSLSTAGEGASVRLIRRRPPGTDATLARPTTSSCPRASDGTRRDDLRRDPSARERPCRTARTGGDSAGGKHTPAGHG